MLKALLCTFLLLPAVPPQTFTISGTLKFGGAVPKPKPNKPLTDDPPCCALHKDPPLKDDLVIAEEGGVRWAFVYLKKGVQGQFQAPAKAVQIDQVGCTYTPHMVGVMPGQLLNFRSSDPMLHNIHGLPFVNPPFNFGLTQGAARGVKMTTQEVPVKVVCDVHPFMACYAGVVEHPFFAVTDAAGRFEIRNVPPGAYTLAVWHEKLKTDDREITVTAALAADFVLNFK
ncbi:MAG: hypothetical protein HY293_07800 [Planctomycetes bacterium]|nr:hypothetical protein [Planctomycetota bacterium]